MHHTELSVVIGISFIIFLEINAISGSFTFFRQEKDGVREGDEESEEGGDTGENPSTTGSLGAQYGGASELFYSQFDLNTRPQKRNQIILIQVCVYSC